jgi:hypothetical protein
MLANATMAPRRRPEIELTHGGESLVVLALAFVVLRPKRMQLMLGHVGRAKARFDNPTEILNPNGLRELTRRPERRSRRCATFENDLRQEESEQRGFKGENGTGMKNLTGSAPLHQSFVRRGKRQWDTPRLLTVLKKERRLVLHLQPDDGPRRIV